MWFCQMCVWLGGSWDAVAGWSWPPTIPLGHVGGWEPWRRVIYCFMVLRVKPRSTGKMIFLDVFDSWRVQTTTTSNCRCGTAAQAAQPGCKRFFSVVVWLRTTLGSFCQVTDMQLTRWWGKLVCFTGTQGRLRVGALLRSLGRTLSAMNSQSGVPEIDRPQTTDTFFDLFLHCPIFFGFSLPQKTSVIWLRNGRRKKQSRLWQELRRRQWVYAAPARSLFFVNRAGISVGQIGSMAVSSEMWFCSWIVPFHLSRSFHHNFAQHHWYRTDDRTVKTNGPSSETRSIRGLLSLFEHVYRTWCGFLKGFMGCFRVGNCFPL